MPNVSSPKGKAELDMVQRPAMSRDLQREPKGWNQILGWERTPF